MLNPYTRALLGFMHRKPTLTYRVVSLAIGTLFFIILLPSLLFYMGSLVHQNFPFHSSRALEWAISGITLPAGGFFLGWATFTQWRTGQGTPAPTAPTQTLVVTGPYRLCRNPIELGAILYYTGLGCGLGNLTIGLVCGGLGFVLGTLYHRFAEEKELTLRFGEAYVAYKQNTPFLIPSLRRLRRTP